MTRPPAIPAQDVAELALVHVPVSPKTVWSFLRLTTSDGAGGTGEASVQRAGLDLDRALAPFRDAAVGKPLASTLALVADAPRATLAEAAVASALEQAIWDACGRVAGAPVWALLGGDGSRPIPLYANINRRTVDRSPEGFAASAREAAAAGFSALKLAPFDDLTPAIAETTEGRARIAAGVARIAAVRDAIGAARDIFVDCHWRFTPESARRTIDALAALRVVWFECPIPERDDTIAAVTNLRTHANGRGMRLAGLEELTSPEAFRPWLAAGAYDVVMPDVKYCGGIADLIAIGGLAVQHGAACAPHNPTGPICHAASLAACAALAPPHLLELQWDETPWFYKLAPATPRPINGECALPGGAGFGVELELSPCHSEQREESPERSEGSASFQKADPSLRSG